MKKPFLCSVLFALILSAPAWAFRFYPIVMEFAPDGPGTTRTFYVENTGEERIAVQISALTRSMDLVGNEANEPADDLFLVYPAQIVLAPGRRQTVRVQWLGDAVLTVERPFRIVAEQLPVSFATEEQERGSINILFRYVGAMYVTPPRASANIMVESAEIGRGDEGAYLRVILRNAGTAHALLADLLVAVEDANREALFALGTDQLTGMAGENVLAGNRREFRVAVPDTPAEGPVNAKISYTPGR